MPKNPLKGFQRRKSSNNALEEVLNPPESTFQSSFKVFERPSSKGKTFDGGHALRNVADSRPPPPQKDNRDGPFPRPRPGSRIQHDAPNASWKPGTDLGRAGGTTETSLSTAGANGSAPSSMRLSTTSTNASSVEAYSDIPVPLPLLVRPTFPGKNRPQTSSFEPRTTMSPSNPLPHLPDSVHHYVTSGYGRDRTVSASTASTATPPRLNDSDLALNGSELNDFSNMFDNIGHRASRDMSPVQGSPAVGQMSSPAPPKSPLLGQSYSRAIVPKPLRPNTTAEVGSSPSSWHSDDSLDRMMPLHSPSRTLVQDSPVHFTQLQALPHSSPMPMPRHSPIPRVITPEARTQPKAQRGMPIRRKLSPSSFPESFPQEVSSAEKNPPLHELKRTQISGVSPPGKSSFEIDPALAASADLATQYEEYKPPPTKPPNPNKVMTPAQFERYREQQDRDRRMYGKAGDSDSEEEIDNYEDDDDELERDRQATNLRRKQEAQLAVYRQTMMKVTGDPAGSRPVSRLDLSESRLTLNPEKSGSSSKNSGDEGEDEDVPLGILAAHGFPNKKRPPTRLSKSPSNSNLGLPNPPAPAGSVAGDSAQRGSLPVFARNLPQDPYFGAGLVNSSNREPLAMNGGASVHGAPSSPAQGQYAVHPAGLVGVIAGEERARALRRGSPNAQGNYDPTPPPPGMPRSQTMSNLQHPGIIGPGILTTGDQAQIQMSQQMDQMMQMQWQWMQQMQQMVQAQGGPLPPWMPSDFLLAPPHGQRPQSMPMPDMPGQRSMSTLNPAMAQWNRPSSFHPPSNTMGGGPGYAPSLAPSERSNIGMASRYRPVSTAPDPDFFVPHRSSMFISSPARPWSSYEAGRRSPTGATICTVNPPAKKTVNVDDDDDDEEGWAEMKAKKDKKQKTWRLRKTQTQGPEFGDLVPRGL